MIREQMQPRFRVDLYEVSQRAFNRNVSRERCYNEETAKTIASQYERMRSIYKNLGWYGFEVIALDMTTGQVIWHTGKIFNEKEGTYYEDYQD